MKSKIEYSLGHFGKKLSSFGFGIRIFYINDIFILTTGKIGTKNLSFQVKTTDKTFSITPTPESSTSFKCGDFYYMSHERNGMTDNEIQEKINILLNKEDRTLIVLHRNVYDRFISGITQVLFNNNFFYQKFLENFPYIKNKIDDVENTILLKRNEDERFNIENSILNTDLINVINYMDDTINKNFYTIFSDNHLSNYNFELYCLLKKIKLKNITLKNIDEEDMQSIFAPYDISIEPYGLVPSNFIYNHFTKIYMESFFKTYNPNMVCDFIINKLKVENEFFKIIKSSYKK